jgi:hypothetical protein
VADIWEPDLVAPPSAASSHLSDEELLRTGSQISEKHLGDCAWCRQRVVSADARAAFGPSDDEFEHALAAGQWRTSFAQASANVEIPERVRGLMTTPASVGDPEPGHLWRLSWRGQRLLVAVIDVGSWLMLVAPVTTDTGLADDLTLRVSAPQSPVGVEIALWVRSRMSVPLFVFDRHLGALPSVGMTARPASVALRELTRAHLTGSQIRQDLPAGRDLTDNDVDRLAMHDALQEQISWFAWAHAGLQEDINMILGEQSQSDTAARPLSEVLGKLDLPLGVLAERTGLPMDRLLDLSRPGAIASPEETAAIESFAGATIDHSSRIANATYALAAASRPAWRSARRKWTQSHCPDADPDDPTPLVTELLERPLAARAIATMPEPAEKDNQLQRYWRDHVAMALQEYQ